MIDKFKSLSANGIEALAPGESLHRLTYRLMLLLPLWRS